MQQATFNRFVGGTALAGFTWGATTALLAGVEFISILVIILCTALSGFLAGAVGYLIQVGLETKKWLACLGVPGLAFTTFNVLNGILFKQFSLSAELPVSAGIMPNFVGGLVAGILFGVLMYTSFKTRK